MIAIFRVILGLHQAIGGIAGLVLCAIAGANSLKSGPSMALAPLAVVAALFVLSAAAGVGLLINRSWALKASVVSQLTQLLSIKAVSVTYLLAAGPNFWVALLGGGGSGGGFADRLGHFSLTNFEFSWTRSWGGPASAEPTVLALNLVAVAGIFAAAVIGLDQRPQPVPPV